MNIKSAFKKIETFASCYNCRASIVIWRSGGFSIVLRRFDTGERSWFTGSLFFLAQREWVTYSLKGAVLRIFDSRGFSEKFETVLHDSNRTSLTEQEAPLWL